MQDQDTPSAAARYDALERDVLYLLTDPEDCEPLWSIDDLDREVESESVSAVWGLERAGLVRRTSDGFVFASRAGVRMAQLAQRAS